MWGVKGGGDKIERAREREFIFRFPCLLSIATYLLLETMLMNRNQAIDFNGLLVSCIQRSAPLSWTSQVLL